MHTCMPSFCQSCGQLLKCASVSFDVIVMLALLGTVSCRFQDVDEVEIDFFFFNALVWST